MDVLMANRSLKRRFVTQSVTPFTMLANRELQFNIWRQRQHYVKNTLEPVIARHCCRFSYWPERIPIPGNTRKHFACMMNHGKTSRLNSAQQVYQRAIIYMAIW